MLRQQLQQVMEFSFLTDWNLHRYIRLFLPVPLALPSGLLPVRGVDGLGRLGCFRPDHEPGVGSGVTQFE